MTGLARYALALAAGLAAMAGWSAWNVRMGVKAERARVEIVGKKIDARAKQARKAVEKKAPEQIRADLRRYCVDCDK